MDIIRRKTDYGLRALVGIARARRPVRAEELAAREDVPIAFLHKALSDLGAAGIVEGQRGPAGGFTLAKPAAEITVLEAIEAMQGPLAISRCLLGDDGCERSRTCGLRWAWEKTQRHVASFLAGITLADMARAIQPKAGAIQTKAGTVQPKARRRREPMSAAAGKR